MLLLIAACTDIPEAPTEMSELASFTFREFEHEEPGVMEQAVLNMDVLLDALDLASEPEDRTFELVPLTAEDVADVPHPDRDLTVVQGMGLAAISDFPVEAHPAYMVLSDLTEISRSAVVYDRTFDVADASCFVDRDCEAIHTDNHVSREAFVFRMEYDFRKDYHWVELVDRGEWAIVSRGWMSQSAHDEEGNNHIWQSFEIEFWIPEDQRTRRYFGIWTEVEYVGVTEDVARTLSLNAAMDELENMEEFLAEDP